jgi:hypothetical protein
MNRYLLRDRTLRSVGYDLAHLVLEVELQDGSVGEYHRVPPHVLNELLQAPAPATYLRERIRGTYPTQRLQGPATSGDTT